MLMSTCAKNFTALVLACASPALAQNRFAGAKLVEGIDTLDTYTREGTGPIARGREWIVRTVVREGPDAWVILTQWYDSTNAATALGTVRVRSADLSVRFDGVRDRRDSAAVLLTDAWASGWVVPAGETPRLFSGALDGPRYAGDAAVEGFASMSPPVGATLVVPTFALYGAGPLVTRADTLRVTDQAVLQDGPRAVRCLVISRGSTTAWVEAATGHMLVQRGSFGGGRFNWYHARRGVTPPQ